MRNEFVGQLEAAGSRYSTSGRKTLIVIDGLDHVPREENPVASFLAELPAAAAVPEGVIFILGTQRIELPGLQTTIIQQTKEAGRSVAIEPLSKASIFALADAANLPSFVDREVLFEITSGHPLLPAISFEPFVQLLNPEFDLIFFPISMVWDGLYNKYMSVFGKNSTQHHHLAPL